MCTEYAGPKIGGFAGQCGLSEEIKASGIPCQACKAGVAEYKARSFYFDTSRIDTNTSRVSPRGHTGASVFVSVRFVSI